MSKMYVHNNVKWKFHYYDRCSSTFSLRVYLKYTFDGLTDPL